MRWSKAQQSGRSAFFLRQGSAHTFPACDESCPEPRTETHSCAARTQDCARLRESDDVRLIAATHRAAKPPAPSSPSGARLPVPLPYHAGRQLHTAIHHLDVVQAQEAALEQVVPLRIDPVYPPRKVDQEFVETLLQEVT